MSAVLQLTLADAAATEALGAALANWLLPQPGAVIYLHGELGAGKTTLARGLLRELGVSGAVRSPTYTLVEPYELGPRRVLHMDLYRLQDPEELVALGVHDDAPERSVWLVEWPERGEGFLPAPRLRLQLQADAGQRRAHLELPSADLDLLLNALRAQGLEARTPEES